jgi:Spy/CpxP family protein refolding chaperone
MKPTNYFNIAVLFTAVFLSAGMISAQEAKPTGDPAAGDQRPVVKEMHDRGMDMLHQLGLSPEQVQQIRQIHVEQKPQMEAAQKRLREATRALNEAIYADQVNEADVHARIKERQIAQANVDRIRFMTEFAVRKVLTPEQLVRFREMREQFERMRENVNNRRQFNGDRPFGRQPSADGNKSQDGSAPVQPAQRNDHPKQNLE